MTGMHHHASGRLGRGAGAPSGSKGLGNGNSNSSLVTDVKRAKANTVKLEVKLLEKGINGEEGPSSERIKTCFEILDDIIPSLGPYEAVMRMLRKEFYSATYSDNYTSINVEPFYESIPFRTIVSRLNRERGEREIKLQAALDQTKNEVSDLQRVLDKSEAKCEELQEQLYNVNNESNKLKSNLRELVAEKASIQAQYEETEEFREKQYNQISKQLDETTKELENSNKEIQHLQTFEEGYSKLQKAYVEEPKKRPVGANNNPLRIALTNMEEAQEMQTQLCILENLIISDFDDYYKEYLLRQMHSSAADADLIAVKENFKKDLQEVQDELKLLSQHIQELDELIKYQRNAKPDESRTKKKLISRYSFMVYTSTDKGESYKPIRTSKICFMCNERVSVCPHEIGTELVTVLPRNCTHLKIARPQVFSWEKFNEQTKEEGNEKEEERNEAEGEKGEVDMIKEQIWEDFRQQLGTSLNRIRPRDLSLDQLSAIIESFCLNILRQDEDSTSSLEVGGDGNIPTFSSYFYGYLQDRYMFFETSVMVAYDIFLSVQKYIDESKFIELFARTLSGSIDQGMWRYLLLVQKILSLNPMNTMEDFKAFIVKIYPFFSEDEVEEFSLEFVAWSENRVSKNLLQDYLLSLIIKGKDPRTKWCLGKLAKHDVLGHKYLAMDEFGDALDMLTPSISQRMREKYYLTAETYLNTKDRVPLERLAEICTYFHFRRLATKLETQGAYTAATEVDSNDKDYTYTEEGAEISED
eukprot:Nk52_evm30s745 gene=Nk52_evmTU30s745